MKLLIIVFILGFLTACTNCCTKLKQGATLQVTGKLNIKYEGFPFVWQNRLIYLSAPRSHNKGEGFVITDGPNSFMTGPTDMAFVSGLVYQDVLYVFGSTQSPERYNITSQNQFVMTKTNDLHNWSMPQVLMTSDMGEPFFNSSVAIDNGGFVSAVEVWAKTGYFNHYFYKSNDLTHWTKVSALFSQSYAACPTIRSIEGQYVVFYLKALGLEGPPSNYKYVTAIAKSLDLNNWTTSNKYVFTPIPGDNYNGVPSINMSDFDLVEHNNTLEMIIYSGDQSTWHQAWKAQYNGTLAQFVREYF